MHQLSSGSDRLTAADEIGLARTMSTSMQFLSALGPAAYKLQAIREAEHQQRVIMEKLKRYGLPHTGYKFVELIGKGAYGRVYKRYVRPFVDQLAWMSYKAAEKLAISILS